MHKVKLADNGPSDVRIWLDNMEIQGVVDFKIGYSATDAPRLYLELIIEKFEALDPNSLNKIKEKKDINRFELMDIDK